MPGEGDGGKRGGHPRVTPKIIEFSPDQNDLRAVRVLLDLAWLAAEEDTEPVGIAILMVGRKSSWMAGSTKNQVARERLLGLTTAWGKSLSDEVINEIDWPEVPDGA